MTLENINSIESLAQALNHSSAYEMISMRIIKSLNLNKEDIKEYCTWSKNNYTRNIILKENNYELQILCWEKGQQTPIYNFSNPNGWHYVIEGELVEEHYSVFKNTLFTGKIFNSKNIKKGGFSFLTADSGYQLLKNVNDGKTISLHLHLEPTQKWMVLNELKQTLQKETISINKDYSLS